MSLSALQSTIRTAVLPLGAVSRRHLISPLQRSAVRTQRRNLHQVMAGGKEIISTDKAPAALGPYSQATRQGNTLYVSGQIGVKAGTKELAGDVEAQTHAALKQMGEILKAGGSSYEDVLKCTVLMLDMDEFAKMNAVYAQYFTVDAPARMAYGVKTLPFGASVEIECIAYVP